MSASTLPLAAVNLFDDGTPWYPFRTTPGATISFASAPMLKEPTWEWADAPAGEPHTCVLLDAAHIAQLVFLSPAAPEDVDAESLPGLLEGLLTRWRCDPALLLDTIAAEFGAWPEQSASHMQRCIIAASRLLGVTP